MIFKKKINITKITLKMKVTLKSENAFNTPPSRLE